MRKQRLQRGATLIEALVAMAVLVIGTTGMVGLHRQGTFFINDARRITRATQFAQDLVNQIDLWDYDDPRLANVGGVDNDDDLGDTAYRFELAGTPPADHGEDDKELGGKAWTGLPKDLLLANGMERYWNVAYVDDENENGIPDAVRIAVIVRWPAGNGWHRVVMLTTKVNGGDVR